MFDLLKRLLASQHGQVPSDDMSNDDLGDAPAQDAGESTAATDDPFDPAFHEQASEETAEDGEAGPTEGQEQPAETFLDGSELDPSKLPPEIQPIWKKMQGVYTKKMQGISEIREKADVVDRFYNDQDFARQTLVQWAAQNGYQLSPINGGAAPQQQGAQQNMPVPQQVVEAFKANLAPELQWLAEPQAKAMMTAMQSMLQPVFETQAKNLQIQRNQEYDRYAEELGNVAPTWQEHEDVMASLHDFLRSDQMFHPKYGSKIQLLYDLATRKSASIAQATERVNRAAHNRPSSSRSAPRPQVNVLDQVAKAPSSDAAWDIAAKAAMEQVRQQKGR